jgi:1,2-diacylglycerol 3-beta-galactosyltransferase
MIVRPEFYRRSKLCRDHERRRLGLRPDLPTGLVMFGGCGSRRMLTIARRVAEAGLKAQFIFLCGRNQRLRARLDALELPFPHHAEGFTREVSYFMSLADFFVGKPGPGSISEALVMELPVIVERNASTMLQERYNTEWILQNHLGVVLRSFTEIAKAIELMLDQHQMARFRRQVTLLNNRAAFEIPEVLDTLIKQPSHRSEPVRIPASSLISGRLEAGTEDKFPLGFFRSAAIVGGVAHASASAVAHLWFNQSA